MQLRRLRLRFWRRFRKGQRQVEDLGTQAEKQIEVHLMRRFGRLRQVQRFIFSWVGLLVLLIAAVIGQNLNLGNYYQTVRSVPGGMYNEGVPGRFTNASPLYATSDADATVSRLIFAGLFKYDNHGKLVGDLAKDYVADDHGSTYTVHLKPHLTWQDGQPLTSADVLYTYQMIQNPDAQSPLRSSWQGIEVSAPDASTVVFKLPGVLASFAYNMTNGIVPQHLLGKVPPADLRSSDFNTVRPVGAGPFMWQAVQVSGNGDPANAQEQVALLPFAGYQAGKPKLQKFVVQVFANTKQLSSAFTDNQLTGVEGLTVLPKGLDSSNARQHNLPLRAANMVFFKTMSGVLADTQVRQALVHAANVPQIIKGLGYPARQVRGPFLTNQFAYDPLLAQASFDPKGAGTILDADGWTLNKQGQRVKDGKPLNFSLTVANTAENHYVAAGLVGQWRALGVKVNTQYLEPAEFQNTLTYHGYEAVLDGIAIGSDPDVFVYWDSSQADIRSANRLNLSEYKNDVADTALEAGRTRLDPSLRKIKYRPFQEAWQRDAPALALYQPRVLYLTHGPVDGLTEQPINAATDRFANVENWEIRQARVTNQ